MYPKLLLLCTRLWNWNERSIGIGILGASEFRGKSWEDHNLMESTSWAIITVIVLFFYVRFA